MLKCGFAQVDITPEFGLHIPGYFNTRISDGIRDPLYARACVIDDGITPLAFVVLDIIHVSAASTKLIRERVAQMTGIPEMQIMCAGTHTHTGSSTDRKTGGPGSWSNENVIITAKHAADAIVMAWNKRVDAKIGYGCQDEYNVAFNRRYLMKDGTLKTNPGILNQNIERVASPIDPQVGVLRIDGADGEPIGAIVNFSVHPDVVGGTWYCADYIGELARTLKKVYGEDFGVVYMNGCCGDINHIDAIGGTNLPKPRQHIKMGRILAGDALAIIERTHTYSDVTLGNANTTFEGHRRRVSDDDYKWALETIAENKAGYYDMYYAKCWKDMYEEPLADPVIEVHSCTIKFNEAAKTGVIPGDVAICSLPGEIFVEIGLELKEKSPFAHTMICELADGYYGYISTKKGIEEGGYETRINKSTNMDKETAPSLVNNQLKLLYTLKK